MRSPWQHTWISNITNHKEGNHCKSVCNHMLVCSEQLVPYIQIDGIKFITWGHEKDIATLIKKSTVDLVNKFINAFVHIPRSEFCVAVMRGMCFIKHLSTNHNFRHPKNILAEWMMEMYNHICLSPVLSGGNWVFTMLSWIIFFQWVSLWVLVL